MSIADKIKKLAGAYNFKGMTPQVAKSIIKTIDETLKVTNCRRVLQKITIAYPAILGWLEDSWSATGDSNWHEDDDEASAAMEQLTQDLTAWLNNNQKRADSGYTKYNSRQMVLLKDMNKRVHVLEQQGRKVLIQNGASTMWVDVNSIEQMK